MTIAERPRGLRASCGGAQQRRSAQLVREARRGARRRPRDRRSSYARCRPLQRGSGRSSI